MMQNKDKIILDLCGGTGSWSKPYKDNGYKVINVTLPEYDVRTYISLDDVYGILAAPPCNEFSFCKTTGEPRDLKSGMKVVFACFKIVWQCQYELKTFYAKKTLLRFWALENPNGMIKYFLGKPTYNFQPYDFGEAYSKLTYLWGWFNFPVKNILKPNNIRKDFQQANDFNIKEYPNLTRLERRSITPAGFAQAFYEANK